MIVEVLNDVRKYNRVVLSKGDLIEALPIRSNKDVLIGYHAVANGKTIRLKPSDVAVPKGNSQKATVSDKFALFEKRYCQLVEARADENPNGYAKISLKQDIMPLIFEACEYLALDDALIYRINESMSSVETELDKQGYRILRKPNYMLTKNYSTLEIDCYEEEDVYAELIAHGIQCDDFIYQLPKASNIHITFGMDI